MIIDTEKKRRKAEYDRKRRAEHSDRIRGEKREYYQRTKSPKKGRALRAKRKAAGHDHTEYCREYMKRPGNREAKRKYDQERLARLRYGEFAEAAILAHQIKKEVCAIEPDKYKRAVARGYYNKAQGRKRDAGTNRY